MSDRLDQSLFVICQLLLKLNRHGTSFHLRTRHLFFRSTFATSDCSLIVNEHSWGHFMVPKWRQTSAPSHSALLKGAWWGEGSAHQQIVALGSRWGWAVRLSWNPRRKVNLLWRTWFHFVAELHAIWAHSSRQPLDRNVLNISAPNADQNPCWRYVWLEIRVQFKSLGGRKGSKLLSLSYPNPLKCAKAPRKQSA